MNKTIGGDRLGSGNKMKVNLHGFERSTHDLGTLWRSTMSMGTLVPFMKILGLPGDTFDINLNCEINTHPTVGPLFGSAKVQLDVFVAPLRLYIASLHNNQLGIGLDMSKVKFPQLAYKIVSQTPAQAMKDLDNSQTNPSSLMAYLGIRGGGIDPAGGDADRLFNAIPTLAYYEIGKQYYCNKQEEIGAILHTPAVAIVTTLTSINVTDPDGVTNHILSGWPGAANIPMTAGSAFKLAWAGAQPFTNQLIVNTQEWGDKTIQELTDTDIPLATVSPYSAYLNTAKWGNITVMNWRYRQATDMNTGEPAIATFPLTNIDDMRTSIMVAVGGLPFIIDSTRPAPYGWLVDFPNNIPNALSSQEGLLLKTYQSDLHNNWIQTEWIDGVNGINEITSVDVSSGALKIDALILARKVYNMLNRIAISGGTYQDWQEAQYDHRPYTQCTMPMYMGGLIKELVFQEVISNSQSEDQPLGTLGGRGVLSNKHKGGRITIKMDEPGYIIGIVSITPRIDYSQGNDWDVNLQTMNDLHVPGLDEIGFQELVTEQLAWWDTEMNGNPVYYSAGKQPAWLNYMTDVNKVLGNFAIRDNEMFMTFNRRYEPEWDGVTRAKIKDLTTYIDPSKFNYIFAETALDAQNYWVQISKDITARRKMSAKLMPNL